MGTVLTSERTLESKQRSLDRENFILENIVYLELAGAILLLLHGSYRYLSSGSVGWLVAGGVLLFLASGHYYRQDKNQAHLDNIRSGRSGETHVSRLLEENLPDDFYILNDVEVPAGSKSAQNDHVVVASGGLFLVETKAYSGRLSGSARDDSWTRTSERGTKTSLNNPITQSEYHAEILKTFLSRRDLPFDAGDVHCFVAMANRDCTWSVEGDDSMVDYAENLPDRILRASNDGRYGDPAIRGLLRELHVGVPPELESER